MKSVDLWCGGTLCDFAGAAPRNRASRHIDTGEHLYILTRSRLFVLRDDSLQAVIDTLDGGDLMVAKTGFGLLEKERLRLCVANC